MNFFRPVDERFPVLHGFAEKGKRWQWLIDDSGLWIPKGSDPEREGQHRGVDFDCPAGSMVSAIADGMVIKARHESPLDPSVGLGLHVVQLVDMPGYAAWWVRYAHLKTCLVEVGQKIKMGQPIGESGKSGDIKNPLLHVDLADFKTPPQYHPIPWKR